MEGNEESLHVPMQGRSRGASRRVGDQLTTLRGSGVEDIKRLQGDLLLKAELPHATEIPNPSVNLDIGEDPTDLNKEANGEEEVGIPTPGGEGTKSRQLPVCRNDEDIRMEVDKTVEVGNKVGAKLGDFPSMVTQVITGEGIDIVYQ
ncbi:hypothetical protein L1987_62036 [Smallanthus sonchifolius]|uniref:Uncharacterized protein n=1 Tax=Smallanthus sonchifolius TaxID=185202 RepID=A0ACB9C9K2_9ASTR|nr:hypothetical protein L1987_62036 [Smallanthus sonchifolius]